MRLRARLQRLESWLQNERPLACGSDVACSGEDRRAYRGGRAIVRVAAPVTVTTRGCIRELAPDSCPSGFDYGGT